MKKLYFLTILVCFLSNFSAQEQDTDRKSMMDREIKNHEKMMDFNVNPNTLNYNLQYQRLNLTLDPAIYKVAGTVTSHFLPNQNMSTIYFDLSNVLTVSQVSYHGISVPFQQLITKELKIDFPSTLPANTLDSLTVAYSGAPPTANQAFSISTQNSVPVLYTLSEPYGAQDWFPTKQSMNDKIERVDFKIITPSQYSVASNGKFMSETINGSSKTTFWRTMYPTAAYLVALSITNFVKMNDVMGTTNFPFVNYIYPASASNGTITANIDFTKQAMLNFENHFGPYPFSNEKYGHMEFSYGGTCMEHQTMSSMSSWGKGVIAHELAHQWFGDKITCGAWNDIWLNEGFATFGEHVTNEFLLMTNAEFLSYLSGQINFVTGQTGGSVYVADANLGSIGSVFSSRLSYSKGGYVLRMLKWILGDAAFYQAMKDYTSRPNLAYNYAKTQDFNASLLQSTGKDFTEFFNDWIYGEGFPTYTIKWNQATNNPNTTFLVSQTQSHASVGFFEMPLPIKVTGTGGQTAYLVLENTTNNQTFYKAVSFPVATVEFNYDYQILTKSATITKDLSLSTVNEVKTSPFALYPNPAHNELFLQGISENADYKIYSAEGRFIKTGNYIPNTAINISELSPETYIFQIKEHSIKFVKK